MMNNNGARNAALADGRARANWILPWDGNCFLTAAAWEALRAAVTARPQLPYFVTPMARIADNADLLDPGFTPEPVEEPQILMRSDAAETFDAAFVYGRRPKVELFWRLGVPGPWDNWRDDPWDPPRRPRARRRARSAAPAGSRASPRARSISSGRTRRASSQRGVARQEAIVATLAALDDALPNPAADPVGLICYASGAVAALRARIAAGETPPLAAALLAEAAAALSRGPFSVIDKTTLPPSRNRHDYWHPAPYWWPNRWIPGGLPYVQRDGMRIPGTGCTSPRASATTAPGCSGSSTTRPPRAGLRRSPGGADFAAHAARNVAAWFVDPATRMTPHLRYAQVRRGRNWNQGTGAGIIEFKDLYYFLDAVRLLERGGALEPAAAAGLAAWLRAYLDWLDSSRQGARERAAPTTTAPTTTCRPRRSPPSSARATRCATR